MACQPVLRAKLQGAVRGERREDQVAPPAVKPGEVPERG